MRPGQHRRDGGHLPPVLGALDHLGPAVLPGAQPGDTYATAGQLSASLDVETTRLLLGEVPAAFHAGVQDILLIAFGLAWNSSPCCSGVSGNTSATRYR
ncbi:hypothetical protein MAHJHV55_52180 [Mycobacterium avium subsp. hominissuis]